MDVIRDGINEQIVLIFLFFDASHAIPIKRLQ